MGIVLFLFGVLLAIISANGWVDQRYFATAMFLCFGGVMLFVAEVAQEASRIRIQRLREIEARANPNCDACEGSGFLCDGQYYEDKVPCDFCIRDTAK